MVVAWTSANRAGSKLPRETRTTAVPGSGVVVTAASPQDSYIPDSYRNIIPEADRGKVCRESYQSPARGKAKEPGARPGYPGSGRAAAWRARLCQDVPGVSCGRGGHHSAQRAAQVRQQSRTGRGGYQLAARRWPAPCDRTTPGTRPGDLAELSPKPAAQGCDGGRRDTAGRRTPSSRTARDIPHPPRQPPPGPAPPGANGRYQGRGTAAIGGPGRARQHAHRLLLRPVPRHLRPT